MDCHSLYYIGSQFGSATLVGTDFEFTVFTTRNFTISGAGHFCSSELFIVNGLERYAGTMLGVVQSKKETVKTAEAAAGDEEAILDVNEASRL